jgi:hypothetical protein
MNNEAGGSINTKPLEDWLKITKLDDFRKDQIATLTYLLGAQMIIASRPLPVRDAEKMAKDNFDLRKDLDEPLKARTPSLSEEDKWVNVVERLPKMGTYIVAVSDVPHWGKRVDVAFYNDQSKGWGTYLMHSWAGGKITHWMELPKEDSIPSITATLRRRYEA